MGGYIEVPIQDCAGHDIASRGQGMAAPDLRPT